MNFKTLFGSIFIFLFSSTAAFSENKSPEQATEHLNTLLKTIVKRDHVAFIKPGTQTFKNAISKSMFNSVCDQVSDNLSKGYSYVYFGYLNHNDLIEHVYKIKCKGINDDFLARITIIKGKVAGFLLQWVEQN